MADSILKQVPFIKHYDGICPCCRSLKGTTARKQKAYAYSPDFSEKESCILQMRCCNNCNLSFFVNYDSRYILKPHNGYHIFFFNAAGKNKQTIKELINRFPEDDTGVPEESITEGIFYHDYIKPLTPDIIKHYSAPSSTIGVFCYQMPRINNYMRAAFIVRGDDIIQDKKTIGYSVNHPYAQIMVDTLIDECMNFSYQNIERELRYCYIDNTLKKYILTKMKRKNIEKADFDNPVDIYVYKGKGLYCNKNHVMEMVTANIISARATEKQALSVYYCATCNEFFVNADTYFKFCSAYGLPPLKLHVVKNYNNGFLSESNYENFNDYSELRMYGYYVSGDMADRPLYRKHLLEDIVDSGLMEKHAILLHLEMLIKTRDYYPGAVARWRSDYDHLSAYHMNKQRIVWGRFTTKQNQ